MKNGLLTPGYFIDTKTNIILPFYLTNADNTVLSSFANDGNSHAYGTELTVSIFPWTFLRTTVNGNFYWEDINTISGNDIGFLNLNNSNWTIKNLFKINKKLTFDITWIYRGASTRRYSESIETHKFDAALRWKVAKGKGNLSLRVTDIFDTYQNESFLFGDGFEEYTLQKRESRIGYLAFTYQFANGESIKKRNRKKREFERGASE